MSARHLILVHQEVAQDVADFHAIAQRVRAMAIDIDVFVVENDRPMATTRRKAAEAPSLVFSPGPLGRFRPLRGTIYAGRPMPKLTEMTRLRDGGIPVPDFAEVRPGQLPLREVLGDVVIVKPGHALASLGRDMYLSRVEDVTGEHPAYWPPGAPGRRQPMIAQRFIDTGVFPAHYRCVTLFGAILFARLCTSRTPRAPLDSPRADLARSVFMPGIEDRTYEISREPDVLALATRTYHALPDIPLQGVDIIREASTGRLFVLEINPGGNTWLFSSAFSAGAKRDLGMDDLSVPFNSWDVAADILVRKTLEQAA
jgi:hypothetical protein